MTHVVGEIGECRGVFEFEWKIADLADMLRPDKEFDFLKSPEFRFLEHDWFLLLKISQDDNHRPSEWLGLYLMKGNAGAPVVLTYTLGIRTSDGRRDKRVNGSAALHSYAGRGSPTFLLTADVLSKNSHLLRSGSLTVVCCLKRSHPDVVSRTDKLSLDLQALLTTAGDSDVTFSVKGVKYPAHRNILGARSPVFASMFRHEMTEKTTGIVDIDDCEASTFQTFLGYLYGGTVEDLTRTNLTALYEVADKYHVDELKADCLDCMKANLSVDGFCDVFALALRHDEKHLVSLAFEFFGEKKQEIIETSKWKAFLSDNPSQANELLTKASPERDPESR